MNKNKRRKVLIRPGLQLRLVLPGLALAVVVLLVQALSMTARFDALLDTVSGDVGRLAASFREDLLLSVLLALGVGCVVLLSFGIIFTFRIAGPLHNIENFLARVASGEQVEECKLREDDELKSLCELVNQVTAEARARGGTDSEESEHVTHGTAA